jgi:hypothetical protein
VQLDQVFEHGAFRGEGALCLICAIVRDRRFDQEMDKTESSRVANTTTAIHGLTFRDSGFDPTELFQIEANFPAM